MTAYLWMDEASVDAILDEVDTRHLARRLTGVALQIASLATSRGAATIEQQLQSVGITWASESLR
ncbi:MAG: hypothetical protein M5U14_09665 [Acidimicrobiia bacterium]|nr:hypothetical protein [Acidimicrobiia bacterium]